jgi:hypothetical protein
MQPWPSSRGLVQPCFANISKPTGPAVLVHRLSSGANDEATIYEKR